MTGAQTSIPKLGLVAEIESHSVRAWPASVVEHTDDGWVLRATPELIGRGRSNHALLPARPMTRDEYGPGLARAQRFAAAHGIDCGVQVSPLDLHIQLLDELSAAGWDIQQAVVVMTGETQAVAAGRDTDFELTVADHATPDWVEAWAHCDGRGDVDAHVSTVFAAMAGTARFAHAGSRAVGISVELDGVVGLFCIAVSPQHRRQGLGKKLVQAMLAQHTAPLTYLQVFSQNDAGLALYGSLGFQEAYRYCHCTLPGSGPAGGATPVSDRAAAASGGGC